MPTLQVYRREQLGCHANRSAGVALVTSPLGFKARVVSLIHTRDPNLGVWYLGLRALLICYWFGLVIQTGLIPVSTRSPNCRSDIVFIFPFSILTFAQDGKQLEDFDDDADGLHWQQRY